MSVHPQGKVDWTLKNKVVVVTGASNGIGLMTARRLLKEGCHVIMACRNMEKAEKIRREFCAQQPNCKCSVVQLDLASLQSVKDCAFTILNNFPKVHVLVNNAGVICKERMTTEDGFEFTMAVNHLGHFLLTRLLLPKLLASQPARIINVSSEAHRLSAVNLDDLNMTQGWNPLYSYGRSKSANILFTWYLSKLLQYSHVTVNSLHPGMVDTNLGDELKDTWFMFFFRCFTVLCCKKLDSAYEGSETTIHLCRASTLSNASGLYFSEKKVKHPKNHSVTLERAYKLWKLSCEMVGVSKELEELDEITRRKLRNTYKKYYAMD